MSDLLLFTDYDSPQFIERLIGDYNHARYLAGRAGDIQRATAQRLERMKRHAFEMLARLGEVFLRVREKHDGELSLWWEVHAPVLPFNRDFAGECEDIAMHVRKLGLETAFKTPLPARRERPKPLLAVTLRLARPVAEMSREQCQAFLTRAEPIIKAAEEIRERLADAETT